MKSFGACKFPLETRILTIICVPWSRALVISLAIQKFRSLASWIFHSVDDCVGGAVRQTAAMAFMGSKIPKRLKKSISMWMSGDHRSSLSRNIAMEGEGLLGVIGWPL